MIQKPGRNDLCPFGSGKKYKKCCLKKEQKALPETSLKLQEQYEDDEDDDLDRRELIINLHKSVLGRKPHIKEYKRIRKLHTEIVRGMIDYHEKNKFELKFEAVNESANTKGGNVVMLFESEFDMETREGANAFYDMLIYKPAPNANCITEEFIKSRRYRKPERIELLQSMLESKLGLFEVAKTDSTEGYAYVKEVFTGREYMITDTGMSLNPQYDNLYIYVRFINYHGVSFSAGLSLMFKKTDPFIIDFIKRHKKDYKPFGEFVRFTELYNRFSKDPNGIKVIGI